MVDGSHVCFHECTNEEDDLLQRGNKRVRSRRKWKGSLGWML